MFYDYVVALTALRRARDLARSALPDAAVEHAEAAEPAGSPQPAGSDRPSWWVTCPCGEWGLSREDHDSWLALCQHLFPQLDRELDEWEHTYGRLYLRR